MIKVFSIVFSLLILPVFNLLAQNNVADKLFSQEELRSDLKYLRTKLEANHPGLYLYTEKSLLDKVFDSLELSISKPQTEIEFYKHITSISSVIKDGHTIILPSKKATTYHNENSKFFPYYITVIDGHVYVTKFCTAENLIPIGAEVLSVNGVSASEILQQMLDRQVGDGDNHTYPTWIISTYFREYYSFIFGHPEKFEIVYKTGAQSNTAHIQALSKDSIYYYRKQNYPAKIFTPVEDDGIKLQFAGDSAYALLTIKSFDNDILKTTYHQNFKKNISADFEQINASKIKNLVIDLRNNQGGDIDNGVILLTFLLDKPFSIVQDYLCVENGELQHCNGPSLGTHSPKPNNFKGSVYILVNGGSFSNSGIVSSCLRANGKGEFVGIETGGNPNVINGFIKDVELPNTKIQVQIPTRQFVITDKKINKGRGLIPTHIVAPSLEDILEDRDTELQFTIQLIKNPKTRY